MCGPGPRLRNTLVKLCVAEKETVRHHAPLMAYDKNMFSVPSVRIWQEKKMFIQKENKGAWI